MMEKRLYRSWKEKMIAGVAGGIGEYFKVDPVIVRIVFVVTTLFSGIGLIAYILMWILVPYEPSIPVQATETGQQAQAFQPVAIERSNRVSIAGIILILIGGLFLADNFIPFFRFHDFWPLVLVAIGVGLIIRSSKK